MECDIRNKIIEDGSNDVLNSLSNTALELIRKHIFEKAQLVNSSQAVTLELSHLPQPYTLSPSERVFEMEKIDLDKKLGIDTTGIRGCYNRDEGKLYLNKELWCIETIIHETLHACSRTSENDELDRYNPLYEGLTEFYTGYILFQEFLSCYSECFQTEIYRSCQMTYEDTTKLWVAFCNFLPLSITTGLYFNNNQSWDESVINFVSQIKENGFETFTNPFSRGKLPVHLKFEIQCKKSLPKEFGEICKNRQMYVDFENVLSN